MENKYFYRTDNSLESMICKLNFSISRLKLYLDDNTTIKEICSSTTIGEIFKLKDTIDGKNDLKLKRIKCGKFGRNIEKISEAIENSGRFASCYDITKAYQEYVSCYQDVVDVIGIIKEGINELAKDSVNNDTRVGQLTQILNPKRNVFLHQRISVEEVENIYSKTIKESYHSFKWNHLSLMLIVILAFVALFCASCKPEGENKTTKLGLCVEGVKGEEKKKQCFSIDAFQYMDTPISMDSIFSWSLLYANSIANLDSIRIIVVDNTSMIVWESIIKEGTKNEFVNKIKNPKRIITIPYGDFCTKAEPCYTQSKTTCLDSMLPLIRSIIFVLVLITILLIIRPLLEKSMDRKSKLNEKIIEDRLRVQNEWQEILQAEYRLVNNRDELELRIREKEENARIEEEKQAAAHSRTLQSREMELEFELEKLEMSQQTNNNQLEAQRIRSLNDQIMRIIISLTSNQQSNGFSNTVANQTID